MAIPFVIIGGAAALKAAGLTAATFGGIAGADYLADTAAGKAAGRLLGKGMHAIKEKITDPAMKKAEEGWDTLRNTVLPGKKDREAYAERFKKEHPEEAKKAEEIINRNKE